MNKKIERTVKIAYVKQIISEKMTVSAVAKELKVNDSTVYDWIKKYKADPANALPGSGCQKPEDAEARKLQDEIKRLKQEVEFLKNVTAYFANDHRKNTP